MKYFLQFSFLLLVFQQAIGQVYTTQNAHSHNDYEQLKPFYLAYNKGFGSIEADIHLVDDQLLVGHDSKDLVKERTLESLYLQPILASNQPNRKLQLLIDIKTDAIKTIDQLVKLLSRYPDIANNKNIKIVLSGNAPSQELFLNYPSFIWFDGRLNKTYTPAQLEKVALISEDYYKVIEYKPTWPLDSTTSIKIQSFINKVHQLGKPVRLWASPDQPAAWEAFVQLGVDYINTDKINELADFLVKRKTSMHHF